MSARLNTAGANCKRLVTTLPKSARASEFCPPRSAAIHPRARLKIVESGHFLLRSSRAAEQAAPHYLFVDRLKGARHDHL